MTWPLSCTTSPVRVSCLSASVVGGWFGAADCVIAVGGWRVLLRSCCRLGGGLRECSGAAGARVVAGRWCRPGRGRGAADWPGRAGPGGAGPGGCPRACLARPGGGLPDGGWSGCSLAGCRLAGGWRGAGCRYGEGFCCCEGFSTLWCAKSFGTAKVYGKSSCAGCLWCRVVLLLREGRWGDGGGSDIELCWLFVVQRVLLLREGCWGGSDGGDGWDCRGRRGRCTRCFGRRGRGRRGRCCTRRLRRAVTW